MSTRNLLGAGLAAAVLFAAQSAFAQSQDAAPAGVTSGDSATQDTGAAATGEQASQSPTDATADTVVATVDGVDITLGQMMLVRMGLPQQYSQLPPDVLYNGILDQLIQQIVLEKSFDGEEPKIVTYAIQNERHARMANEAINAFLADAVTEEQVQAAYDEQFAGEPGATEYKARHILVETEEEARAIIEELDGGADFATLAQEKSTGPSGPNGGDLGWFGPGMMVKPFEDATVGLEPGSYGKDPVQTQFGWHVILLEDKRDQAAPELEEVRGEIEAELQNAAVKAHIDALIEQADIDRSGAEGIDPSMLTNTDLLE